MPEKILTNNRNETVPRDSSLSDGDVYYCVKTNKNWFRKKDVFTDKLYSYEMKLVSLTGEDQILLPIDAGNMIYVMMQRLEVALDWRKQTALMAAYRDLVYRLSHTSVIRKKDDSSNLIFEGHKSDVLWTLTFISQVFPKDPLVCVAISQSADIPNTSFTLHGGKYSGAIEEVPNIWSADIDVAVKPDVTVYDPHHEPAPNERFMLPDGRSAVYVRMDERFYIANTKGRKVDGLSRHNISASLIKDFEDLVNGQTKSDLDVYQLRYSAFMNKTHELEQKLGGFEPTVYDILPVAERGLPQASRETILRTNSFDQNSLRYLYDRCRSDGRLRRKAAEVLVNAIRSIMNRKRGYEAEYRMYIATGSTEEAASKVLSVMLDRLYKDFAYVDTTGKLNFPQSVYAELCNRPASNVMTDWERQRIRNFGKGYADFLDKQIRVNKDPAELQIYRAAKSRLVQVFE